MDIWKIDLEHAGKLEMLLDMLDERERAQASRFRFDRHARRYIVSHAAMRCILSSYLGVPPRQPVIHTTSYGKPYLAELVFNLSHSEDVALCAVAGSGEIGVDVEYCREDAPFDLADSFFSAKERAAFATLPDKQSQDFYACWTRKEAYIKAKGLGLSLPLDAFSVEFRPGLPASLIASEFAPEDVGRFRLWDVPVTDGYRAAMAYCGDEPGTPRLREWAFA